MTKTKKPALPNLKAIREAKGLSQSDLAKAAELSSPMIVSRLEVGFTSNPSIDTVVKIAKALGVKIEKLL